MLSEIEIEIIRFGAKIELLQSLFKSAKLATKEAKIALHSDQVECDRYGGYSDCGDFYESAVLKSQAGFEYELANRINLEKTLKWHKHRLRELRELRETINPCTLIQVNG